MREDTFTTTEAAASRYDQMTFPDAGGLFAPPPDPKPVWDCGHLPVRDMETRRWLDRCAGGKGCPNGGWGDAPDS